ncbi:adhesion G-protein coupled receptor G6-like [Epinephelus moara]|uniref:adhesion G-protein coupled receptor G6-like n=1 Tax=Epinephelus moara TaxID=300413 RepID=UPI00214E0622|nr:adhesion G-protein coupled receptor G6-like [Epinephelus moara]
MNIIEDKTGAVTGFSRSVVIPTEAIAMAVKRNGSFAAVLLFPGMHQDDPERKGNWITDGCETKVVNDSITCQCSHLTFFAILLSPAPGNISASDLKSLTYITSVGCGLSMFFLAVALFMYFLIRKGKASQATKILMNLFVAMFNLNLSFLVNETIAKMGNFNACVIVAAVMHYTMLATFSWFFIQALHLCWIPDAVIHQGVNIGYYGLVFIFTFGVFVFTVRQIMLLKPKAGKAQDYNSIKTNSFSIFGLFLLLGITWAFAFFSYGPLRIPSYYIFTILNSFQGFFLFIYYYNSSKFGPVDRPLTVTSSSTATTKTVVSPLQ